MVDNLRDTGLTNHFQDNELIFGEMPTVVHRIWDQLSAGQEIVPIGSVSPKTVTLIAWSLYTLAHHLRLNQIVGNSPKAPRFSAGLREDVESDVTIVPALPDVSYDGSQLLGRPIILAKGTWNRIQRGNLRFEAYSEFGSTKKEAFLFALVLAGLHEELEKIGLREAPENPGKLTFGPDWELKEISINDLKVGWPIDMAGMTLSNWFVELFKAKSIDLTGSSCERLVFENCEVDEFILAKAKQAKGITFINCTFKTFDIREIKMDKQMEFRGGSIDTLLADGASLTNVIFKDTRFLKKVSLSSAKNVPLLPLIGQANNVTSDIERPPEFFVELDDQRVFIDPQTIDFTEDGNPKPVFIRAPSRQNAVDFCDICERVYEAAGQAGVPESVQKAMSDVMRTRIESGDKSEEIKEEEERLRQKRKKRKAVQSRKIHNLYAKNDIPKLTDDSGVHGQLPHGRLDSAAHLGEEVPQEDGVGCSSIFGQRSHLLRNPYVYDLVQVVKAGDLEKFEIKENEAFRYNLEIIDPRTVGVTESGILCPVELTDNEKLRPGMIALNWSLCDIIYGAAQKSSPYTEYDPDATGLRMENRRLALCNSMDNSGRPKFVRALG